MMKKLVFALAVLFFATNVYSLPINDRVAPLDPGAGDGSELSVQQILDNATGGTINAVTDQSNVALWTTSELDGTAYKVTYFTGNTGSFGLYSNLTGVQVDLFSKTDSSPISPAGVQFQNFLISDVGDLYVAGNTYSGFGNVFGFYWDDGFTEDDMNDGEIMSLVYNIPADTSVTIPSIGTRTLESGDDWFIAFGDQGGTADDFNDLVVLVEDISPVPEPATLLLLGSGLVGLAFLKRRKS